MKTLFYLYGWIFVRPRRWLFWNMVRNTGPRWIPKRRWCGWQMPNIHWYILYSTIFRFMTWLHYDAWRSFCKWDGPGGMRSSYPMIARIIKRIGSTTAGFAISGGECFHCGSPDGDQVYLSEDEGGSTFILEDAWSVPTMDGTDHRFCGTTICPRCGYRAYYEDGSL